LIRIVGGLQYGDDPGRPAADDGPGRCEETTWRGAMTDTSDDRTVYKVVINHEEQYSIWPADRDNPNGWTDAGKTGLKAECLAYIEEVWTDMRPLSLRQQMDNG